MKAAHWLQRARTPHTPHTTLHKRPPRPSTPAHTPAPAACCMGGGAKAPRACLPTADSAAAASRPARCWSAAPRSPSPAAGGARPGAHNKVARRLRRCAAWWRACMPARWPGVPTCLSSVALSWMAEVMDWEERPNSKGGLLLLLLGGPMLALLVPQRGGCAPCCWPAAGCSLPAPCWACCWAPGWVTWCSMSLICSPRCSRGRMNCSRLVAVSCRSATAPPLPAAADPCSPLPTSLLLASLGGAARAGSAGWLPAPPSCLSSASAPAASPLLPRFRPPPCLRGTNGSASAAAALSIARASLLLGGSSAAATGSPPFSSMLAPACSCLAAGGSGAWPAAAGVLPSLATSLLPSLLPPAAPRQIQASPSTASAPWACRLVRHFCWLPSRPGISLSGAVTCRQRWGSGQGAGRRTGTGSGAVWQAWEK